MDDQLIVPDSTFGEVIGPAAVTSVLPPKVATLPTARSPSAAFSMIFFFFIWLGLAGGTASRPSQSTRSPGSEASGGSTKATVERSSDDAQRTMPFDGNPPNFAGFRLHTTNTFLPVRSSAVG